MKSKKKVLLVAVTIMISCLVLAVVLLLYPNYLFGYEKKYSKFSIYSDQPLTENWDSILNQSLKLAKQSEIFDSTYTYDIFVTEGTWYKTYVEALLGPTLARSMDNNILLNGRIDVVRNELGESSKRELMQTIAHEMVHCLMLNKYGMLAINPVHHPPMWKIEGYPEYISRQQEISATGYDFFRTASLLRDYINKGDEWIQTRPGFWDPLAYFKARVMIEFLFTKKKMKLDQLMEDSVQEEKVFDELMIWYSDQQPQRNLSSFKK